MPFSASFSNITSSSARFTASFTGGDGSFTRHRYVELTIDGFDTYIIESTSAGGSSSSFSETIYGLDSSTTYTWEAMLGFDEAGDIFWLPSLTDSGTFRTAAAIDFWDWFSSNGSATAAETERAYNVVMGNVTCDGFSHKVWNDIVDKVAEARDIYYDGTWDRVGGTYLYKDQCYVSAGDTLSADVYNTVKYNISSIPGGVGSGIYDVLPGERLTGRHIYRVTETINETIEAL